MILAALLFATAGTAAGPDMQVALITAAYDLGACEAHMPTSFVQATVPAMLATPDGAPESAYAKAGHIAAAYAKGRADPKRQELTAETCGRLLDEDKAAITAALRPGR